jgi:hypothetical protein
VLKEGQGVREIGYLESREMEIFFPFFQRGAVIPRI